MSLITDDNNSFQLQFRDKFKTANTALSSLPRLGAITTSENGSDKIQSITQTFAALRKMINDYEDALKIQIQAIEEKNKMSTDNYRAILNRKEKELSACSSQFERILSDNDHALLLESKGSLTTYLDQLANELKALKPPVKTEYQIKGLDQLQTSFENILKEARVGE